MKNIFTILLAITALSFASCKKCETIKCGRIIVTDSNAGGSTTWASPDFCDDEDAIDVEITAAKANYPGGNYTTRFDQTSTKEECK